DARSITAQSPRNSTSLCPKESGVPKALKWTAAAAEQFQIIPTMPNGALSPVFLGQEECVAVVDELTPLMGQELPLVLDGFQGELHKNGPQCTYSTEPVPFSAAAWPPPGKLTAGEFRIPKCVCKRALLVLKLVEISFRRFLSRPQKALRRACHLH